MTDASPVTPAEEGLTGGSYEVIRGRLVGTATALAERAEALNQRRRQEFGGQDLTVLATERIRTANSSRSARSATSSRSIASPRGPTAPSISRR